LSKPKTTEVVVTASEVPKEFKALPFRKNLFENSQAGRLSVPPPRLTKPMGFNLSTEVRGTLRTPKKLQEEQ
jgi:hypothetical protein